MIPSAHWVPDEAFVAAAEASFPATNWKRGAFYGGKGFGYVDRAPAFPVLGAVFEPLVGACPSDHHRLVNGRSCKGPITRDTVGAKFEMQLSDAKVDVLA